MLSGGAGEILALYLSRDGCGVMKGARNENIDRSLLRILEGMVYSF